MINYKYYVLWITPERSFIGLDSSDLNGFIRLVEDWYRYHPRDNMKPKIVCNTTGRVVYE